MDPVFVSPVICPSRGPFMIQYLKLFKEARNKKRKGISNTSPNIKPTHNKNSAAFIYIDREGIYFKH